MSRLIETYKPRFGKERTVKETELELGKMVVLGTREARGEMVVVFLTVSSEDSRKASVEFNHLRTNGESPPTTSSSIEGKGTVVLGRTKFTFES